MEPVEAPTPPTMKWDELRRMKFSDEEIQRIDHEATLERTQTRKESPTMSSKAATKKKTSHAFDSSTSQPSSKTPVQTLPTGPSAEKWLTLEEAAAQLGLSGGRLYALARDGEIQPYHVGRKRFFKESDVQAMLTPRPVVIHERAPRSSKAKKAPRKRATGKGGSKKARKR